MGRRRDINMFVRESAVTGCVNSGSQGSAVDSHQQEVFLRRVAPLPAWKRSLDIVLIVLLTPIWLPVMTIIALGIKLLSKGPVIFRQERIGYRGQTFLCLKFRSMRCGADIQVHKNYLHHLMTSDTPMVKLDQRDDPRLIPFGHLLRASGLDELPQIINVLRGEMSLVGPRPCTEYEYERYEAWQKDRLRVLPGLTGLWQVTGKNKTTFDEMVRKDIHYAQSLSLRRDVWILAKTFGVILNQVKETLWNKSKKAQSVLS